MEFGEKSTVLITFIHLLCLYIHCGSEKSPLWGGVYHHVFPWVNQYSNSVGFTFSITQVPEYPIELVSHSNYRAMWNWSKNFWWGHDGKRIIRWFLIVV